MSTCQPDVPTYEDEGLIKEPYQNVGLLEDDPHFPGIVELASYWHHFKMILASFWDDFGIILGSFGCHFGIILVSFGNDFGFILAAFWNKFFCFLQFWHHFSCGPQAS